MAGHSQRSLYNFFKKHSDCIKLGAHFNAFFDSPKQLSALYTHTVWLKSVSLHFFLPNASDRVSLRVCSPGV